ncbi:uncharacterized protein BX663DRAFT_507966 [Cokeromyces recurvatus]|uniref:uncharacterized protein n=1 Tax=Cokeromyces recurvatus TaxID=90255 RepID=UPI0022206644|nr:uncharacterized protein BX663DRAFT_507966 [Cokeromyces recurvatus]KAI7903243.1 hypothetical protein BX663DRAFT_507966 [Cokeromyces recurvatus]
MNISSISGSNYHIPTVTTPLLSDIRNDIKNKVKRVPTFVKPSIPNRRTILKAFFNITLHLLFELVLPIVLYYIIRNFCSLLLSLLLAGIPNAIAVIVKGIWERKVDMMGILMLIGFIVSALLASIQSDPRLYLLRESAMTLAMGFMLFLTLFPLKWPLIILERSSSISKQHILRPFMFYVARQVAISCNSFIINADIICEHWDLFWNWFDGFRCFFRTLTAICSMALISEFIVRIVLIHTLDNLDSVIYYSNIYMLIVMITLGGIILSSTLLLRHYFNLEQNRIKIAERASEIEAIIARAAVEQKESLVRKQFPFV